METYIHKDNWRITHADASNRPAFYKTMEKKPLLCHTLVDSQALEPTLWLDLSPLTNASLHRPKLLWPLSLHYLPIYGPLEPVVNTEAGETGWGKGGAAGKEMTGRGGLQAEMGEWNKNMRVWLGSPFSNQISHSWRLEYGTNSPPSPSSDTSSPSPLSGDQLIKKHQERNERANEN